MPWPDRVVTVVAVTTPDAEFALLTLLTVRPPLTTYSVWSGARSIPTHVAESDGTENWGHPACDVVQAYAGSMRSTTALGLPECAT